MREADGIIADAHERLSAELHDAGLIVETNSIHGKPERAIVEEAKRFAADLIVIGARGQGAIGSTLMGSVSRAVVENASRTEAVIGDTTTTGGPSASA